MLIGNFGIYLYFMIIIYIFQVKVKIILEFGVSDVLI